MERAPEAKPGRAVVFEDIEDFHTRIDDDALDVDETCVLVLHLHVSDDELAVRRTHWKPPVPCLDSGYWKLYTDTVLQADEGADLDFLRGKRGAFVPRDHH